MPPHFREHRQHSDQLIQAALRATDPAEAVRAYLRRDGGRLYVGEREYTFNQGCVFLIAVGKAAVPMARAAAEILGDVLSSGVVITKHLPQEAVSDQPSAASRLSVYQGSHPVPDGRSVQATAQAIKLLAETSPEDLVLCLISGGASALFTDPLLELSEWQALVQALLASGCTIQEMNTVRQVFDRVKGGGLARLARPAACASLLVSDVVGNPLEAIGSGPTWPGRPSPTAARAILERYQMADAMPTEVWGRVLAELQTVERHQPSLATDVHHVIIADVRRAAEAAVVAAQGVGFSARLLTVHLEGEAREAGRVAAALAKDAAPNSALILGGETTVTIRGGGKGGRNQELALAAAVALEGWPGVVVASFATDGEDGPTEAAGAWVDGETAAAGRALGLDPLDYLRRNDSYTFFSHLDNHLYTGPTGTNVNDLVIILRYDTEGI